MTMRPRPLAVLRHSARVGVEDLRGFYTWRTWIFGWLSRVTAQVIFFGLVGSYLGSPAETRFLLVGASAVISVLEAMVVVLSTSQDRDYGLLPLLVSAPANYFLAFISRNVNYVATGTASSTLALSIGALVLHVPLPWPAALAIVPLLLLGAVSTYVFASFLGALVARAVYSRWVVLNVAYMGMLAVCGFVTPVGYWPRPVQLLAQILPYTHALRAIRGVVDRAGAGFIGTQVAFELIVMVAWAIVARAVFAWSIAHQRRIGAIDLSA